jgi:uncharacterized protein (TIRG00374 family)
VELATVRRLPAGRVRALALRSAIGVCAGAILLLTFLRLTNVDAVLARLEHLSVGYAVLCGIPFLGAYVVRALRWRCFLRPDNVSVGTAVAIYQVATFVNWLLPVRGGEVVKCMLLRRTNGIPVGRSLATVSMDKAMDLLPAVVLIAVLPFAGLHLDQALWVLLATALAVVLIVAALLAIAVWRRDAAQSALVRPLARVLPPGAARRIEPAVGQFLTTLAALIRQPRLMLTAVAYTGLAVFLDALFCLLAFKAVGVSVSLPLVLYGYTFFNLAFILPTPPGQVGSNELIGLLLFAGVLGMDKGGVGAMFLFSHPWTAVLMTVSGLACLSAMGVSLGRALRLADDSVEGERA